MSLSVAPLPAKLPTVDNLKVGTVFSFTHSPSRRFLRGVDCVLEFTHYMDRPSFRITLEASNRSSPHSEWKATDITVHGMLEGTL